jgi:16S rRNA (cytidine1402-2'-O)-methyltransferase
MSAKGRPERESAPQRGAEGNPVAARGRLLVIPSTLGDVLPAEVIPPRTVEEARRLRHLVAETPKSARAFMKAIDSLHPLQDVAIEELSEHTASSAVDALLAPALAGDDLGLISDAGSPGIADPGAWLVAAAHRAGIEVVPLPGASAIALALAASGLDGQRFCFHGYLPAKPEPRASALRSLDERVTREGVTQLFIETPYRNEALLTAVLTACRPSALLCVAVDLTLSTQQVIMRPIGDWRRLARPSLAKRPAVFLLGRDG